MASHIPEDFDSEWDFSNVYFHTQNSDGKELHANKTVLAVFSPYFKAMFFGNYKEAHETNIHLACDYEAVKEILRIVHHVSRDFSAVGGQNEYDLDMLKNLYMAADMLDFPVVRKICEAQMLERPSIEMANVAHSLCLHDLLMTILSKIDSDDVDSCICDFGSKLGPHLIFTKKDVATIQETIYGKKLVSGGRFDSKSVLNLEEISDKLENPKIDLTKKWPMSDISLLTKNSQGRGLYSNKAGLAMDCPYFQKLFFENQVAPEFRIFDENLEEEETVVPLDVEYATMKQILSIVHNCSMDFSRKGYNLIHPVLLHDMYLAAAEDNLDIPLIRKFCCDNLLEQPSIISFEVAVKLGLSDIKSQLVMSLPEQDLCDWTVDKDIGASYLRDGKEVLVYTDSEEQVLSANDLKNMEHRLHIYTLRARLNDAPIFSYTKRKARRQVQKM